MCEVRLIKKKKNGEWQVDEPCARAAGLCLTTRARRPLRERFRLPIERPREAADNIHLSAGACDDCNRQAMASWCTGQAVGGGGRPASQRRSTASSSAALIVAAISAAAFPATATQAWIAITPNCRSASKQCPCGHCNRRHSRSDAAGSRLPDPSPPSVATSTNVASQQVTQHMQQQHTQS